MSLPTPNLVPALPLPLSSLISDILNGSSLNAEGGKEGKGARVPFFDELDDRPLCD